MLFQFLCKYSEYFPNTDMVFVKFIIVFASKCRFALNLQTFILLKSFCFKIMLILLMNDFSSSVMASN